MNFVVLRKYPVTQYASSLDPRQFVYVNLDHVVFMTEKNDRNTDYKPYQMRGTFKYTLLTCVGGDKIKVVETPAEILKKGTYV